jgi:hypothetical protein
MEEGQTLWVLVVEQSCPISTVDFLFRSSKHVSSFVFVLAVSPAPSWIRKHGRRGLAISKDWVLRILQAKKRKLMSRSRMQGPGADSK